MPKTTHSDRYNNAFLHQVNSQRAMSGNFGISLHGVQCLLKKFEETGRVKDKRRRGRPKTLSPADK